jgi:hypothetical protein
MLLSPISLRRSVLCFAVFILLLHVLVNSVMRMLEVTHLFFLAPLLVPIKGEELIGIGDGVVSRLKEEAVIEASNPPW